MLRFVAIFILILTFLQLEFILKFEASINAYHRVCSFVVYIFGIRAFESRLTFDELGGSSMMHVQQGRKHSDVKVFSAENIEKLREGIPLFVFRDIAQELVITELGVIFKIGSKNALNTTMLMGSARILYCWLLSFLKGKRTLKSHEKFLPYYNEEVFIIDMGGIIKLSIADIILISTRVLLKARYHKKSELTIVQKPA